MLNKSTFHQSASNNAILAGEQVGTQPEGGTEAPSLPNSINNIREGLETDVSVNSHSTSSFQDAARPPSPPARDDTQESCHATDDQQSPSGQPADNKSKRVQISPEVMVHSDDHPFYPEISLLKTHMGADPNGEGIAQIGINDEYRKVKKRGEYEAFVERFQLRQVLKDEFASFSSHSNQAREKARFQRHGWSDEQIQTTLMQNLVISRVVPHVSSLDKLTTAGSDVVDTLTAICQDTSKAIRDRTQRDDITPGRVKQYFVDLARRNLGKNHQNPDRLLNYYFQHPKFTSVTYVGRQEDQEASTAPSQRQNDRLDELLSSTTSISRPSQSGETSHRRHQSSHNLGETARVADNDKKPWKNYLSKHAPRRQILPETVNGVSVSKVDTQPLSKT